MPTVSAAAPGIAVVADDDEFFRIALASILRTRLGYATVHETASLDEALERLAETPGVTLALFDLAMPGMASAASLAAVRECHPQVLTAVVSGSTRREDVLLALKAGVHGFVPKAVGVDDLTQALTMIVSGWIYVPAFIADVGGGAEDAPDAVDDPPVIPVEASPSPAPEITLTPRQRQVLGLLVEGQSNKMIARRLQLGEGTVKIHVAALLKALGVSNRSAAAAYGARLPEYGSDRGADPSSE